MGTENLQKFFGDSRIHVIAARVEPIFGETSHFRVNAENNVTVSVVTHHYGMPMRANLSNGPGVWTIPDVGTEVMLASDNGDIEGEVYVIGTYGSTSVQNAAMPETTGPQTFNVAVTGDVNITVGPGGRVRLISDTEIEMASTPGGGKFLSIHDELHRIWEYLGKQFSSTSGHAHIGTGIGFPIESAVDGTSPTLALIEPVGTQIAKGE